MLRKTAGPGAQEDL